MENLNNTILEGKQESRMHLVQQLSESVQYGENRALIERYLQAHPKMTIEIIKQVRLGERESMPTWDMPEAKGRLSLQFKCGSPTLEFETISANFMDAFNEALIELERKPVRNKSLSDLALSMPMELLAMIDETAPIAPLQF